MDIFSYFHSVFSAVVASVNGILLLIIEFSRKTNVAISFQIKLRFVRGFCFFVNIAII